MRTILHISKYYYPDLGGIESVAMYLAEGLKEFRNIVVCFASSNQYSEEEINGVRVYRIPVNFSLMSQDIAFSYSRILRKLVAEYRTDAVHVHCPNPFVYPIVCSAVDKQTKVILHWHSDILGKGLMYTLIKPFENAIVKRADLIISTSPNYIPHSKPLSRNTQKVRIVQNGIQTGNFDLRDGDREQIRKIRSRYEGRKIVFTCGRHVPYKGLDKLIKADSFIDEECVILIGGEGHIDNSLRAIPHSERVKFLGRLSDDELRQHLYAADIFAFPSNTKAEAFGVALAEAMYCHCVPVCFRLEGSGVNWVSLDNETGISAPINDIKALAQAIDTLLHNEGIRERYAQAAGSRIRENFTTESAVEAMKDIYQELFPA